MVRTPIYAPPITGSNGHGAGRLVDVALDYFARGWTPLPIDQGEKSPHLTGWPDFRWKTAADLEIQVPWEGCNICLILGEASTGLVDIDLDCPEAVALAPHFLPATPARFGRASKRESHWLYQAEPLYPKITQFHDVPEAGSTKRSMLVEYRANGGVSVVPPSVHPSGEHVTWHGEERTPAVLDGIAILQAARQLAIAVLLARHWPGEGSRHQAALASAGLLLRDGVDEAITTTIVTHAARVGGDEEWADRAADVRTTAEKLAAGDQEVTGGPALEPLLLGDGKKVVAQLHRWLGNQTAAPASVNGQTQLANAIRTVMLNKKVSPFDKPRVAAEIVHAALSGAGRWIKSADGRFFYFKTDDRRLYDLESPGFCHLLSHDANLAPTEKLFKFIASKLVATLDRTLPTSAVHTLSHYDAATGQLAISDGGSGIWLHARGGSWTHVWNGDHELFFATPEEADPWDPAWGPDDAAVLQTFFDGFLFADDPSSLTRAEYQQLLRVYLLQLFFPDAHRTRMIAAFLGPQGSGKTMAEKRLGRLLVGPRFQVTPLEGEARGEDAFVAAVTNTLVFAIDNADSRVRWLEDKLATYATGARYRKRRLYSTNEEVHYDARAVLLLNSRDPHFKRPDVVERLLPIRCVRPVDDKYLDEACLLADLDTGRGRLWGALLSALAVLADGVADVEAPPLKFRMADFASFGWKHAQLTGGAPAAAQWVRLLEKLQHAQMHFAASGDGLIEALRVVLTARPEGLPGLLTKELFDLVRTAADDAGYTIPRAVEGFGQALTARWQVIEGELGVTLSEQNTHGGRRRITITPARPRRTPVTIDEELFR